MESTTSTSPEDLGKLIGAQKGSSSARWITWLIVVSVLAGLGYFGWTKFNTPTTPLVSYATEPLARGDISLTITATGNLEPTNEVTIGSVLSGNADEVFVDINDRVKKGQELAKITIRRLEQDTDNSRAALNSARAKVKQVEATLAENEASLARLQELHKLSGGKTPSKADMVTAQASVARAQADLGSAKASVEQAEAELRANESDQANAILRSPIDGIVLTRSLEPGQTVAASFTAPELFVIAENLEHMKLKVAVAEADIGRVQADQQATFSVDAWPDRSYEAKVTRVSFGSAITDNVVTYETELEVSNKDLSLRPGMTATADIHVAKSDDVLIVPTSALRFNPSAASSSHSGFGGMGGGGGGGEKKSFVQSLIPSPRRSRSGPRSSEDEKRPGSAKGKHAGHSQIWILRNGKPEAVPVKTGLSDGRYVEVSGEGLEEGMAVITRTNSIVKP
ncbi:HlyD family secretion protein [Prosthecobacter debontii]|uniref:HlyD family secretion protein n=1 Tax=Prosthecobacter debontii TaxID=48467 RepID=A0A1T4WH69_9BACT|nr:efflux RND transporter periplasmic adaptor subunit [Prosthecobacter debontii]SKA76547.1 HlyD family secretion protein [Prosthecobacter debontii]